MCSISVLILQVSEADAASFCRVAYRRLAYAAVRPIQSVIRPGLLFTGYASSKFREVSWDENRLRQVVEVDGIQAPLLRNYAEFMGITPQQAREKLSYLKESPEDISNFLIVSHAWESLSSRSPFISGSRSKGAASSFGPFGLFSSSEGPSVILTYKKQHLPVVKQTSRWSSSCELVGRLGRYASREDVAKVYQNDGGHALKVWDWLESHHWLSEMTLPYGHEKDGKYAQRVLNQTPRERFLELGLNHSNIPSWADLKLMKWWEQEETILLHIPPESILNGQLFDKQGGKNITIQNK